MTAPHACCLPTLLLRCTLRATSLSIVSSSRLRDSSCSHDFTIPSSSAVFSRCSHQENRPSAAYIHVLFLIPPRPRHLSCLSIVSFVCCFSLSDDAKFPLITFKPVPLRHAILLYFFATVSSFIRFLTCHLILHHTVPLSRAHSRLPSVDLVFITENEFF
jgi:hypothetical protein